MSLRGYNRDEYEDLDEYEEEEEDDGQEEAVDGNEYESEVEEAHQPTEQELEYLELRQKLKESYRKEMKKDSGSSLANSREKRNKLPYDNYGSFFGPSQPVIAQRVIEESKSLLENPYLAEKFSKPKHGANNKVNTSVPEGSRPRLNDRPPKVTAAMKAQSKVQMLKNTRDYSFLLSDDAELPAPKKDPPLRNAAVQKHDERLAQPQRSKQLPSNNGKKVVNGRDVRRPMPPGRQMQPKVGPQKLGSANKTMTSVDHRKPHGGSNNGIGPGRPGPKALTSKAPMASTDKKILPSSAKNSMPGMRKPLPSKSQPSIPKQNLDRRKELQEHSKGKLIPRQPVSSKPQIRQLPVRNPSHVTSQQDRIKKRPARQHSDDEGEAAINMIRKMFKYNPDKYRDDDDVSDMEANFDDILREERRSAKIAKKEDDEEYEKIQEEERREQERLRKKRKLSR